MARPDKYAQWVILCESEHGLTRREQSRRVGVDERTLRDWEKGIIPKGGPEALTNLRAEARGRDQARIEGEVARRVRDAGLSHREKFDALVETWFMHWPQLALALPVERMKALAMLLGDARNLREAGELRDAAAVTAMYVREARAEEQHLISLGLPNLVRTLSLAYRDVETREEEGDVIEIELR